MKVDEAIARMQEIRVMSKEIPLKDNEEITEVIGLLVLAGEQSLDRIEEAEARIKNLEKTIDGVLLVLVKMLTPEKKDGDTNV